MNDPEPEATPAAPQREPVAAGIPLGSGANEGVIGPQDAQELLRAAQQARAEAEDAAERAEAAVEQAREIEQRTEEAARPRLDSSQRMRRLSPLGSLLNVGPKAVLTRGEREEVLKSLFFEGRDLIPYLWRFAVLIVLSTMIAAFGLVANSVAVIIGAMLVAPLMTPIMAAGAAVVLSDWRRLLRSGLTIVGGTIAAIFTGYLTSYLVVGTISVSSLPSEILSRTQPSLLDLGVAISAGLAGGYVITHPKAGSSLPGVAIAVALVPPLATCGIMAQLNLWDEFRGALLLFSTNLVAIILSSIIVMLASGYRPEAKDKGVRGAKVGLVVSSVMLVVVSIPLTVHTVQVVRDQRLASLVVDSVAAWDRNATVEQVDASVNWEDTATVEVTVSTTSSDPPQAWRLAQLLESQSGYEVAVELRLRQEGLDEAVAG